jgi:hypothetical protein
MRIHAEKAKKARWAATIETAWDQMVMDAQEATPELAYGASTTESRAQLSIEWAQYQSFHRIISTKLRPDMTEEERTESARKDWVQDVQRQGSTRKRASAAAADPAADPLAPVADGTGTPRTGQRVEAPMMGRRGRRGAVAAVTMDYRQFSDSITELLTLWEQDSDSDANLDYIAFAAKQLADERQQRRRDKWKQKDHWSYWGSKPEFLKKVLSYDEQHAEAAGAAADCPRPPGAVKRLSVP